MLEQYRGLKQEVYVLSFGRLVSGLGSMIWPMMTLILSQKMHIGAKEVAWLLSVAMIVMAPAVYLGGKIADIRDKKMTIVILNIISVICYGMCAFIPMSWFAISVIFIASVCQNMEHPAYTALLADVTTTDERDRAYSLQYMCANLGLVLAPTISGFLFKNYLWLAFLINALSILSATILIFFMVKDTTPVVETTRIAAYQKDRAGESLRTILRENKVVVLFILVMSGYYAVYQMYVYLMPLDLAVIHGDAGAVIYGSVTSVNCLVVVLFTPLITRISANRHEPDRITAGVALMVTGFALFAICKGIIPMYYISMTVLTWGEIFALTTEGPCLSRRIPSSHRGQINGIFTVIKTLLASAFQIAVGTAYGDLGSAAAWIVVLAVGVMFIILSVATGRRDRIEYPNLYE